MAGLYDIAASGISAYRNALSVTGQNIAVDGGFASVTISAAKCRTLAR